MRELEKIKKERAEQREREVGLRLWSKGSNRQLMRLATGARQSRPGGRGTRARHSIRQPFIEYYEGLQRQTKVCLRQRTVVFSAKGHGIDGTTTWCSRIKLAVRKTRERRNLSMYAAQCSRLVSKLLTCSITGSPTFRLPQTVHG